MQTMSLQTMSIVYVQAVLAVGDSSVDPDTPLERVMNFAIGLGRFNQCCILTDTGYYFRSFNFPDL